MSPLLQILSRRLDAETMRQLGRIIDADDETTTRAVAAVIPLLLGVFARQANESRSQAQALLNLLKRTYDGGLLDRLPALLTASTERPDAAGRSPIETATSGSEDVLRHTFGEKREPVARGVSRFSRLELRQADLLMHLLASLLLHALGRIQREEGLDADGIARLLNRERAEVEKQAPGVRRGGLMDYIEAEDDETLMRLVSEIGALIGDQAVLRHLRAPV